MGWSNAQSAQRNRIVKTFAEIVVIEFNTQRTSLEFKKTQFIEQVFGKRTYRNDGQDNQIRRNSSNGTPDEERHRTLCVRKTDGYYFPISFSTTPERFRIDNEICQNMCPGNKVGFVFSQNAGPG